MKIKILLSVAGMILGISLRAMDSVSVKEVKNDTSLASTDKEEKSKDSVSIDQAAPVKVNMDKELFKKAAEQGYATDSAISGFACIYKSADTSEEGKAQVRELYTKAAAQSHFED